MGQALESESVSSAVFLHLPQTCDRVWHESLLLSSTFESYMTYRHFLSNFENSCIKLKMVRAGVLQRSILGTVSYLLSFNDVPNTLYSNTATLGDDSRI